MDAPLTETLFRLALARTEAPLDPAIRAALERADEPTWEQALNELAPHKLFPLLAYQLSHFGLFTRVPVGIRAQLGAAQQQTLMLNAALIVSAASLLRELERRSEQALLMKGALFANDLYPDASTRPMGDVDVVAAPGRHEALLEVVRALGFRALPTQPQPDAVIMELPSGVRCDVHRRLDMFGDEPWDELTREVELRQLKGVRTRALEPSAMLAHLAVHMGGHLDQVGPVLLWFVDVALVLRRFGHELDPERVARFVESDVHWALLLRLIGLLARMGEPMPARFAPLVTSVPPLSLATVLRQRRTTPWELPRAKGVLRLLAQQLRLRSYPDTRPRLSMEDVLRAPLDDLSARVVTRRARRPS